MAAATGLPQVSSWRSVWESAPTLRAWSADLSAALWSPWVVRSPISPRSAPAQKPEALPEQITAPLIAASVLMRSISLGKSRIAPAVMVFIERPGTSKVTSATPSASTSRVMVSKSAIGCFLSVRVAG